MRVIEFVPVVDGAPRGLLDRPPAAIAKGNFHDVPVLMSTTKDEGSIFLVEVKDWNPACEWPVDETCFDKLVEHFYDQESSKLIEAEYKRKVPNDSNERAAEMATDGWFGCASRAFLMALESKGSAKNFRGLASFQMKLPNDPLYGTFGDWHSCDLAYIFHKNSEHPLWRQVDWDVADAMGCYYSAFVHTGSPMKDAPGAWSHCAAMRSKGTMLSWPEYHASTDKMLVYDDPMRIDTGYRASICNFWDKIGYATARVHPLPHQPPCAHGPYNVSLS